MEILIKTLVALLFLDSVCLAGSVEKTKLEKDISFVPGNYEVVKMNPADANCFPAKARIYGHDRKQILYLGTHLIFSDINAGATDDSNEEGCSIKSESNSRRDELKKLGIIEVKSTTMCSWGIYKDETNIKFFDATIEYGFSRKSENENKEPSFKVECLFKKSNSN